MNENQKKVVEVARGWNGRSFFEAKYGAYPFCASFVRHVYLTALGKQGEMPVAPLPPRYRRLGLRFPVGPWFADSLAGDEIGPEVTRAQLQPGDLLFFQNTYGKYPAGTITHIGIHIGRGEMAHAAGGGVVVAGAYDPAGVVEARRPRALGATVKRTLITLRDGKAEARLHGAYAREQAMEALYDAGLHVSVNGKPIRRQFFTVLVSTPGDRGLVKIFHHDHKSAAFRSGQKTSRLHVRAELRPGGLHVWVDGREVKADRVVFEGV